MIIFISIKDRIGMYVARSVGVRGFSTIPITARLLLTGIFKF